MSQHTLTVPGRYDKIREICEFVSVGATQAGLDDTAVFHVELACDEACTNVIEHAYGGEDKGNIVVSWDVSNNRFQITIQDNGRPFDPNNIPKPDTDLSPTPEVIDNLKVGGLGIHFMRKLMDEVIFHFDQERGNLLVMVKQLENHP